MNDCLATTLEFDCLCTTNNSAPGLQYYTQTMPTFICEEEYQKCISEATNNAGAQAACAATEKAECGHLDPANFTAVAASPSATASSSRSIPPSKATSSSTSTFPPNSAIASSPPNSATSLQPHQGLSTGAKAGIGVGVAFGVLTFILGLWLAFWYGRRTRSSANDKKSKPDKKAELEASEARKPELADTGVSEMGEPLSSEEKKELENRRRAVELEGGSINVPPGFSERTELEARRRGDVFELS